MTSRDKALAIWRAGVDAVRPERLIRGYIESAPGFRKILGEADRILVVGGGKAGAAMADAFEQCLPEFLPKMVGVVNVPDECVRPLQRIRLHGARPAGSNFPTAEGVAGSEEMLKLLAGAREIDVCISLISGGGSALLPAPVNGVPLAAKLAMTRMLHECGASIQEMNCIRKHLSRIKGGGLASAFTGWHMFSLIISDVLGDPLDVIASGPTAEDPTTFSKAHAMLVKYKMLETAPREVVKHFELGKIGRQAETLKHLPSNVKNHVLAGGKHAVKAAAVEAGKIGYRANELGMWNGVTIDRAKAAVHILEQSAAERGSQQSALISGGETTVELGANPGKGGRNQELALAMLCELGDRIKPFTILCAGTDGEDGPTDAAGAFADIHTWKEAKRLGLDPHKHLAEHNAYPFFEATGSLLRTGLTGTNVMDLRVMLVE